jgi:4-amino-4-deoxy-L-arabinose transferase-like glycosyltransferase
MLRVRRLANAVLSPSTYLLVFFVVSCFLFFHRLADRDLWSSHEARAGMDAQGILDGGGWGLPRLFDGRPELQKPPLYYWLVAAIARCRGGAVDAWAVRLPAALAGLGCVLALTFGLGRGRTPAGLLAGTVLATAVHFTWLARIGRIDLPLTLAVTVAAGAMYRARSERRPALRVASYLAVAVGVLLKGPVGALLPAAVVGLHLLVEARAPRPTSSPVPLGLWWGVPLVLALTLPWFLWANAHTGGEFFRVFLWHHNVERGLGGSSLRASPWWFYAPQFAVDFLPWTPLLLAAGVWCYRHGYWRADPDLRFGLAWFVAVLLVLSCARFKRADYLLPAYPGAALFLGCALRHRLRDAGPRRVLLYRALTPLLAGLAVAGWVVRLEWVLPANEPLRDYRRFAAEVRGRAPRPREVVFFRTEAHALAFHVGRPLAVLVEWEELRSRLRQPGTHYVVMPAGSAGDSARFLAGLRLEEVLRNTDLSGGRHERPLVLLRSRPGDQGSDPDDGPLATTPIRHARAASSAAGRDATAQRGAAGP